MPFMSHVTYNSDIACTTKTSTGNGRVDQIKKLHKIQEFQRDDGSTYELLIQFYLVVVLHRYLTLFFVFMY